MLQDAIMFEPKEDTSISSGFKFPISMDKLGSKSLIVENDINTTDTEKKKAGRKKKTVKVDMNNVEVKTDLPIYQTNENYINTYNETNMMLKNSVGQIDILQSEIKSDIDQIRSSKTLKKKYDYISELTGTMSTLIGTKVTAIRELNKTITDSHNLDMKRMKEMKLNAANEADDNKSIMDMYNAFISAPVGMNYSNSNMAPSIADMTTYNNPNVITGQIGNDEDNYKTYLNNLSPSQNMMLLESNPNIKTVVVYDAATGNRWFDVMDMATGQSVPNTTKPDQMFLEDTTIDLKNNIARNINLDAVYPLVVLNNNQALNEY